jgi:Sulfotransferase family
LLFLSKETGECVLAIYKCGWSLMRRSVSSDNQPVMEKLEGCNFYTHDILVRDPVERFISFYKDKVVRGGDHECLQSLCKNFSRSPEDVRRMSIDEILDEVKEKLPALNSSACNEILNNHLAPQQYIINTYGLHDENTKLRDIRYDIEWLKSLGINPQNFYNNTSNVLCYVTKRERQRIASVYKDDVILYEKYKNQNDCTTHRQIWLR